MSTDALGTGRESFGLRETHFANHCPGRYEPSTAHIRNRNVSLHPMFLPMGEGW